MLAACPDPLRTSTPTPSAPTIAKHLTERRRIRMTPSSSGLNRCETLDESPTSAPLRCNPNPSRSQHKATRRASRSSTCDRKRPGMARDVTKPVDAGVAARAIAIPRATSAPAPFRCGGQDGSVPSARRRVPRRPGHVPLTDSCHLYCGELVVTLHQGGITSVDGRLGDIECVRAALLGERWDCAPGDGLTNVYLGGCTIP